MAARDIIQAAAGAAGATEAVYVEDVFSTYLYTGTDAAQTITNGIDLSTKGGMVWLKNRAKASSHVVYSNDLGASNSLSTNNTAAANLASGSGVTSFNNTGFTLGSNGWGENFGGDNIASWTFRKQPKFFDVVTWTGNEIGGRQISHNLGCKPGMIIIKQLDTANDWMVLHKGTGTNQFGYMLLNSTAASVDLGTTYTPTSTYFLIGNGGYWNASGGTYVAYLFADSNSGGFGSAGTDSVVACGSFTTDANGSGSATLGWEPQFLLMKASSTTGNWFIYDPMRGFSLSDSKVLYANLSNAEATYGSASYPLNPTATGFSASNILAGNQTYIYLAIRRGPMKTPTDATKVFYPSTANGSTSITTGFPVDLFSFANKVGGEKFFFDRLRGGPMSLDSTTTAAEANQTAPYGVLFDNNTGSTEKYYGSSTPVANWLFRRAPGFFDVVCYTGTGDNQSVTHNLGVMPQLIIVKRRSDNSAWFTYNAASGVGKYLMINNPAAVTTLAYFMSSVTSTAFIPSTNNTQIILSGANNTYVAYLFATCPGVSKVFSFTGNGSSQTIDCGFTSGARFVLIKRTDSTGDWYVWDTARGINPGNDPHLSLNTTAAEVTDNDTIDTAGSGFIVNQVAATNVNVNNATYIGLAIA